MRHSRDIQEVNVSETGMTVTRVCPGLFHPMMIKPEIHILKNNSLGGGVQESSKRLAAWVKILQGAYNQALSKIISESPIF